MSLIRQLADDLDRSTVQANITTVDTILSYFNRQGDYDQRAEAIQDRYGYGLKLEKVTAESDTSVARYAHSDFDVALNSGMIDNVSSGFGYKVSNARGTMFTEPGQKFTLLHETIDNVELAEALLNDNRTVGGFLNKIIDADIMGERCGSAAIYVSFLRDSLFYQVLSPADLQARFADYIEDNGVLRSVDRTDLEDASEVIIRLGQIDYTTWNYLAICGRSADYPQGRHVTFVSGDIEPAIPQRGDKTIGVEFEINGKEANPLSYWANLEPDLDLPEYPIAIFKSGIADSASVMPVTSSLHQDCLEFDIAASHTISASQKAARGTRELTRTQDSMMYPLPDSLEGDIATFPGQALQTHPGNAGDSLDALKVLKESMVNAAAGYGVPDYMVVTDDHTLEANSGIALAVKTQPLKKERKRKVDRNGTAVKKLFTIEKHYIYNYSPAPEPDKKLLYECDQSWDPGEFTLPENKLEATNRIVALIDKGIMDTVAAIREYYQLATDEEAMEMYDKMKERKKDFPPLTQEKEKPKFGSFRRGEQNG